jgi:hypothetical protein
MADELKINKGQPSGTDIDDESASKEADSPTGKESSLIADIDFSDVPEEHREAVKAKVASKVKNYQSGFTKKTDDIAKLRKDLEAKITNLAVWEQVKDDVEKDPELAKKLNKVWDAHKKGVSLSPGQQDAIKDKNLRTLDKLIDQTTDPDNRESLRNLRTIIAEETGKADLEAKIKLLEDKISLLTSTTRSVQMGRVKDGIKELEDEFGSEMINKYYDSLLSISSKPENSRIAIRKIFLQLADDNDIETAYLNKAKLKQKKETDRKKKGLEPGGDNKITPLDVPRDKSGRVNMKDYIRNIVAKRT